MVNGKISHKPIIKYSFPLKLLLKFREANIHFPLVPIKFEDSLLSI